MGFEKNILCIGAGYVGGPTMAMIAYKCPQYKVVVVDIDKEKIEAWKSSSLPIFEPGLDEVVKKSRGRNLFFSTDIEKGIQEGTDHLCFRQHSHKNLWPGRRQGCGFAVLGEDGAADSLQLQGQQGRCGEIHAPGEDRIGHGTDSQ